ncbi:MAG: hypothetical protein ACJAUL_003678 [Paraglaciecola sp.]|jgi:hypothetical protein
MDIAGLIPSSQDVEGIVEIMLNAAVLKTTDKRTFI